MRKTIHALLLAPSLGLAQMMLSPIKSAPLQDIASAVSRSQICHNLQVFGANFFVAKYASVRFKSLSAALIFNSI